MEDSGAETRERALVARLAALDGAVVAFSGGVDSTYLTAVAAEALGERALAITGVSPSLPARELAEARTLARQIGVRHETIETREIEDISYLANAPQRCYHCKSWLFTALWERARAEGLAAVLEGSNRDDLDDFRPGLRAVREAGVLSPLLDAGLTKQQIRGLSQRRGLATWNKPASACLASRIPFGEPITEERLQRIEQAEAALRDLGAGQVRVRDHAGIARIEVEPEDLDRLTRADLRAQIASTLRRIGFRFVTIDLEGFRSGSLSRETCSKASGPALPREPIRGPA